MITDLLKKQLELVQYTLQKNLAEVSHAQSVARPASGGSSINWVLGHILKTRDLFLRLLGEEPAAGPEYEVYGRGAGELAPDDARPLAELLRELDRSRERVLALLGGLSDADLERAVEGVFQKESTLGEELAGLVFHECYHAGQLGVLRRDLGKPGAIG